MATKTKTKPAPVRHVCDHCGAAHAGKNNSRFCSLDCRLDADQKQAAARAQAKARAKAAPARQRPEVPVDPARLMRVAKLARYTTIPAVIAKAIGEPVEIVAADLERIPPEADRADDHDFAGHGEAALRPRRILVNGRRLPAAE